MHRLKIIYAQGRRFEPDRRILEQVRDYLSQAGLPDYRGDQDYLPVHEPTSRAIADWYDQAPHSPKDKAVQTAYQAMTGETLDQFRHLQRMGVELEPWTRSGQPYANSQEMRDDAGAGHLYYFTGGDFGEDNLLAQPSPVRINGRQHSYNDLFRGVHDYFGHALYGNEFGPRGEEHAWRTHGRMYTPKAKPAMSMETRGQNSWVNFGPHLRRPDGSIPHRGESGYVAPTERPFAEQKNNILPAHLLED